MLTSRPAPADYHTDDTVDDQSNGAAGARSPLGPGRRHPMQRIIILAIYNRDEVLESARTSYNANPEKKKAAVSERYQADPEKKKAGFHSGFCPPPPKKSVSPDTIR